MHAISGFTQFPFLFRIVRKMNSFFVLSIISTCTLNYFHFFHTLNTQYLRNPDFIYLLKMEYVHKINIFGLKMMAKSGLDFFFYNFEIERATSC